MFKVKLNSDNQSFSFNKLKLKFYIFLIFLFFHTDKILYILWFIYLGSWRNRMLPNYIYMYACVHVYFGENPLKGHQIKHY